MMTHLEKNLMPHCPSFREIAIRRLANNLRSELEALRWMDC
jgi:hypothetical protein